MLLAGAAGLAAVDGEALETLVVPKENSGVVVVVAVPPLVTVQFGFLANGDVEPPMGVLGLPKENVAVGLGEDETLETATDGDPREAPAVGVDFVPAIRAFSSSFSSFRCFS